MPTEFTWPAIKTWLNLLLKFLEPLFELFKGPELAIGISLIMIALAVIVLLAMIWQIVPMWRTVSRLTRKVWLVNGSYSEFSQGYGLLDEELRKPKYLRHGWIEFTETLTMPVGDDDTIRNSARPQDYLNLSGAEASGKTLRFLQALPNYFVGFGLLFTFLGLVAAIYFASQGVASGSVELAQESLRHLLSAATFKFMTSIVGLAASIILSLFYRTISQALQRRFDRLAEALEKGMLWSSAESLAFQQVGELENQTAELKRFNTEFAIEVGKVMEERLRETMTGSLESALGPLRDALEKLSGNLGEMNQDALKDMANSFRDNLKDGAGQEMEALVSTLNEIKGSLSGVVEQVDSTSGAFGEKIAEATSKMETAFEAIGGQLQSQAANAAGAFADEMREASSQFGEQVAPLSNQIGRFESAVGSLEAKLLAQRSAFEDVASRVREITQVTGETIDELRSATSPLNSVSERLASTAEAIDSAGQSFTVTQEQLQRLSSEISGAVDTMQTSWSDYQSRFENVDESLGQVVNELVSGADLYRQNVQEFVTDLDSNFQRAVTSLAAGVESLEQSVDELVELQEKNRGVAAE